jgi:mannose-6-phosphate isomerase-like protein (cupin superfamily)
MRKLTRNVNLAERYRIALDEAETLLPTPEGKRSAAVFEHGTLQVKIYAPRGNDPQSPHTRDEIYVVARGEGWFVNGELRHRFATNDVLFAKAGVPHRFEDFSDDFVVWVFFYGPEGGERDDGD